MHSSLKVALIPTVKCLHERFRPVVLQYLTIFVPRKHLDDSLIISSISNCLSNFDLNEILYGPKWLSGKDIWTDVKVWTLQCFFFFFFLVSVVILRHDSIKKETSVFKKIFPLLKKNCIPSSHWLQAVVQICGGQCSFKTIPKIWTWWGATYSLSLIIVWYTVLLHYL